MPKYCTLSGWAQPHDALDVIAPNAQHIDYLTLDSFDDAVAHIAEQAHDSDILIGWSLGGLLAIHAVASGHCTPRKLVLLSTPHSFVQRSNDGFGMPEDIFQSFVNGYKNHPKRTLKKFDRLISHGDTQHETIDATLTKQAPPENHRTALYWLECLGAYDSTEINTDNFPATTIIHGENDAIVTKEQAELLHQQQPNSQLHLLPHCCHAPHLHNAEYVRQLIYS